MKTVILTEGSSTTSEDESLPALEFFEGSFSIVSSLRKELANYSDVEVQIISQDYGFLYGDSTIQSSKPPENGFIDEAVAEFIDTLTSADVVVLLLTKDTFKTTIIDNWEVIVENAKPESLWCISTSRNELDEVNVESLRENGCDILTYQRVGVARINNDTRKELIERVIQKAD
jgi:hypothetical protein